MPTIRPNRSIQQERKFSTPTMCGGSRCSQLPWRGGAGNLSLHSTGKSCGKPIDKKNIAEEKRMFLGDYYVKVEDGKWRSVDRKRQVRIKKKDYSGTHRISKPTVPNVFHMHLEFLKLANNGQRYDIIKNIHIPLK